MDRVYIAIGVGESFTAIDALLTAISRDRIQLGHDMCATIASWLDCYHGQDTAPRLRRLLTEIESCSHPRTAGFEERFASAVHEARDRRSH